MNHVVLAATVALLLPFGASAALAKGPDHCPPGLAKKSPACVPPGLAKRWGVGDRYDGHYDPVRDWRKHRLPRPASNETWIRAGDVMLRVDEQTMLVIEMIAIADLLLD